MLSRGEFPPIEEVVTEKTSGYLEEESPTSQ
jgi:hypothetical protein